jgi:hypothetical protein
MGPVLRFEQQLIYNACLRKQCCGSGSEIRDPGLGAFLTPGSGIRDGKQSASGSGIRDEQSGSYFLELRNHSFAFLGSKYLNSLMRIRDLGSGIRDGDSSDPGSGMEKSRIRAKHPGSATLSGSLQCYVSINNS